MDDLKRHLNVALLLQIVSLMEYLLGIGLSAQSTRLNAVSQFVFAILIVQAASMSLYIRQLTKTIRNRDRPRFGRTGIFTIALANLLLPFLVIGVATLAYSLPPESMIAGVGPFLIPSVVSGILLSFADKDVAKAEFFKPNPKTKYWKL